MRAEYDFSKAKRGALIASKGKTRITIYLDNDVLDAFRTRAEKEGTGYQTMINDALRAVLAEGERPVTEAVLRRVIREEMPATKRAAAGSRKTPRRLTSRTCLVQET
ncbi:MAG: BrnA antitoxin family protein [Aromatoleum sp.]|nr:BrnA antitoxin family protein [Aromatoleum sp.]